MFCDEERGHVRDGLECPFCYHKVFTNWGVDFDPCTHYTFTWDSECRSFLDINPQLEDMYKGIRSSSISKLEKEHGEDAEDNLDEDEVFDHLLDALCDVGLEFELEYLQSSMNMHGGYTTYAFGFTREIAAK